MKAALIASVLLVAAAPATSQTTAAPEEALDSWSWCVTDATSPNGPVRYFSDPFEGGADESIGAGFAEYVRNAYAKRDQTRGFTATCHTDAGLPSSQASLRAAMSPKPGARDVPTAWRFHFE